MELSSANRFLLTKLSNSMNVLAASSLLDAYSVPSILRARTSIGVNKGRGLFRTTTMTRKKDQYLNIKLVDKLLLRQKKCDSIVKLGMRLRTSTIE